MHVPKVISGFSFLTESRFSCCQRCVCTAYLRKEHVGRQTPFRGIGVYCQHRCRQLTGGATFLGSLLPLTLGLDFLRHWAIEEYYNPCARRSVQFPPRQIRAIAALVCGVGAETRNRSRSGHRQHCLFVNEEERRAERDVQPGRRTETYVTSKCVAKWGVLWC
jgi:hypothetical protein